MTSMGRHPKPRSDVPGVSTVAPVCLTAFAAGFSGPAVESPFAFLEQMQRPLAVTRVVDTWGLRGIIMALHFGLAHAQVRCWQRKCRGRVSLRDRPRHDRPGVLRYSWHCPCCHATKGVQGLGVLSSIRQDHWAAFFYFLSFLCIDVRWSVILAELKRKFQMGLRNKYVPKWLNHVQKDMNAYMNGSAPYVLGDSKSIVVVDETAWGKGKGISKAPVKPGGQRRRELARVRIKKRLPARTTWTKKGEALSKEIKARMAKRKPGPKPNRRTRWVWLATLVGTKDGEKYTHDNGKKQVVAKLLPMAHQSRHGKPRGEEELKALFQGHTKRGAISVTDEWPGTMAAIKRLRRSGQHKVVKHQDEWRNKEGWHTNDGESENGRMKQWARTRHGKLPVVTQSLLDEYMFGVNVGRSFDNITSALSSGIGGGGLPPSADDW